MPRVTIIIATRNRWELLLRAVESARYAARDVEIIVVDDASEDQTAKVCQDLVDIRHLRVQRQLGPGGARNVGIIASTSEYISFLDDDDVRLPGSIDKQLALLNARPDAGMIYGQASYGDVEGRPKENFYPTECPQGDIFWQLMRWNFVPCPTVVFRRACLYRIGMLDEAAPGIEDWDLWIRIAELYPVLAFEHPVSIWRQSTPSSQQFTSRASLMHQQARRLHANKWLRLPRVRAAKRKSRRAASRAFADYAAQQMLWDLAGNLKTRPASDSIRVALALATTYPLGSVRKTFQFAQRLTFAPQSLSKHK